MCLNLCTHVFKCVYVCVSRRFSVGGLGKLLSIKSVFWFRVSTYGKLDFSPTVMYIQHMRAPVNMALKENGRLAVLKCQPMSRTHEARYHQPTTIYYFNDTVNDKAKTLNLFQKSSRPICSNEDVSQRATFLYIFP